MDQPHYGDEEQRNTNLITYGITGVLVIFILVTVGSAVGLGVTNGKYTHFVLAVLQIAVFSILVLLMHWYRQGDLDPKFKWLIVTVISAVLVTGTTVNLYVWKAPPVFPSQQCANGNGLYIWNLKQCISLYSGEPCLQRSPGYCMRVTGNMAQCIANCSGPVPSPGPGPGPRPPGMPPGFASEEEL
eukprot:TRINITY_DN17_c0_g1_i3.p1 TRINITY_DN17_c0_g1~~TRINITY_DN17_c0_g1_i3.p1  ORF type:complete len:186 (+),score=31.53 TRINITY_DN17_c0_g1_i3:657-1214(+)